MQEETGRELKKCLKGKRRKIDIIAAVTIQRAIYICPLFWGRDSYSDFKEKKLGWSDGVRFA